VRNIEFLRDFFSKQGKKRRNTCCISSIFKLNPVISNGTGQAAKGFIYNKDAGTFQCPVGNLSVKKVVTGKKNNTNKNQLLTYYFDIEKCKTCPCKESCYKNGAKNKT